MSNDATARLHWVRKVAGTAMIRGWQMAVLGLQQVCKKGSTLEP